MSGESLVFVIVILATGEKRRIYSRDEARRVAVELNRTIGPNWRVHCEEARDADRKRSA